MCHKERYGEKRRAESVKHKKPPRGPFVLEIRYHWCVSIPVENRWSYDLWPSCDPSKELCDAGINKERLKGNKHLWTSTLDQFRKSLKWKGTITFDEWVQIVYVKVSEEKKMQI